MHIWNWFIFYLLPPSCVILTSKVSISYLSQTNWLDGSQCTICILVDFCCFVLLSNAMFQIELELDVLSKAVTYNGDFFKITRHRKTQITARGKTIKSWQFLLDDDKGIGKLPIYHLIASSLLQLKSTKELFVNLPQHTNVF